MGKTENEKSVDISKQIDLLKIYSDNWRQYDKMIWEIPSLLLVIGGVVIALIFQSDNEYYHLTGVIFGAFLVMLAKIVVIKHHYFQHNQQKMIDQLEEQIFPHLNVHKPIRPNASRGDSSRNAYEKISAFNYFVNTLTIIFWGMILIGVYIGVYKLIDSKELFMVGFALVSLLLMIDLIISRHKHKDTGKMRK